MSAQTPIIGDSGEKPTFSEAMNNPILSQAFFEFVVKEFSSENYQFIRDLERLTYSKPTKTNAGKIKEKFKAIYNMYIVVVESSDKQVNLSAEVRDDILKAMAPENTDSSKIIDAFQKAGDQIWILMEQDSYTRFLASDLYTKAMQNPATDQYRDQYRKAMQEKAEKTRWYQLKKNLGSLLTKTKMFDFSTTSGSGAVASPSHAESKQAAEAQEVALKDAAPSTLKRHATHSGTERFLRFTGKSKNAGTRAASSVRLDTTDRDKDKNSTKPR